MSSMILGVKPADNGFKRVSIKPHTLGLSHAKGRVPIPNGYIDVSWKCDGGKFTLDINSNRTVTLEITLPGGKALTVETDSFSISE